MYIFLDVDGVLNTEEDWKRRIYSLNAKCIEAFGKLILMINNPKIVLSSSWRNGIAWDGTTAIHIEDLMKVLKPYGIKDIDIG